MRVQRVKYLITVGFLCVLHSNNAIQIRLTFWCTSYLPSYPTQVAGWLSPSLGCSLPTVRKFVAANHWLLAVLQFVSSGTGNRLSPLNHYIHKSGLTNTIHVFLCFSSKSMPLCYEDRMETHERQTSRAEYEDKWSEMVTNCCRGHKWHPWLF